MLEVRGFKVRDFRDKGFFIVDNTYLNGYAKHLGTTASMVYLSLCRHADKEQKCFPSQKLIAEELGINERTVMDKIANLIDWNIIRKNKIRSKKGKWAYNVYLLLDKSEWKEPPVEKQQVDTTYIKTTKPPVEKQQIKDTHIKDTHILSKDNTGSGKKNTSLKKISYGNPDINSLIDYFKKCFNLPVLDETVKKNRHYCQLAINKFGGPDKVRELIDLATKSEFWANKITSFVTLYYKGVRIVSETRENRSKITFINPK
jgi:predicted transcriptional regulator